LFSLAGCDQGHQDDEPQGSGLPIGPLHLVSANIGPNQPLPANGRIELEFDRLLLPLSITRQTFVLEDIGMTTGYMPTISYDPVARIVTITPLGDPGQMLIPQQGYKLVILAPQNASDPNGLRAIDGSLLAGPAQQTIAFTATDALPAPPPTVSIDFCRDIHPIFATNCALSVCHEAPVSNTIASSAAGLVLDPPSYIQTTAIGRVAQGANTGPLAAAAAPSLLFGEDMPIIDATGNASNSWLMYKVLLAAPTTEAAPEAGAETEGGGSDGSLEDAGAGDSAGSDGGAGDEGGGGALDAGPADGGTTDGGTTADGGPLDGGTTADGGPPDGSAADGGSADGGVASTKPVTVPPVDVSQAHALPWTADSSADRAVLSNYVLGREMPYPGYGTDLTLDELERLSLWISQGSAISTTCPQ
jgi:hypothetical protein